MAGVKDPLVVPGADDTGSETLRRYRYQAAYAAWLAIMALDGLPAAVAIYCEHHDDVLIEFSDGCCDAIQVKSQGDGVAPLKGNSEPVLNSLRRFAVFEHEFGSRFRNYRLASIAGFHRSGTSASNLHRCLEQAKACVSSDPPEPPLSVLIRKIKTPSEVATDTVVTALQKVRLDETLPKLGDMEAKVRNAIERLEGMGGYRASDLVDAASAIIDLAIKATEVTLESTAEDYFSFLDDPDGHAQKATIAAKRLSLDAVKAAIHDAATNAANLRSKDGGDISKLPTTSAIAHRKLDAGGMPVHTVAILDDLRSSAEEEIERRLYRDGETIANSEYDHIQVLVETLAEDARQEVRGDGSAEYGQAMWGDLRQRLQQRRESDPESTAGFSPEQMTGVAMILTELCRVWWSEPFSIEAPSDD